ncbi:MULTISPECIES: dihydroorotase family protein [unclassified Salinibacterium]|uniref:dihydroorotase n=1 Tax=unclassified Salinibacterium TaxID=2632331 RepID=UPI001F0DFA52|nr:MULTISPECIES: dihydroorotase family protein [unclassified Salinibacterium]
MAQAAVHGGVTTIANQLYPQSDETAAAAIDRMIAESVGGTADYAAHVRWDRTRGLEDLLGAAEAGAISIKVFLAHPDKQIQSSLGDLVKAMSSAGKAGLLTLVHAELGDVVDDLGAVGLGSMGSMREVNAWRSTAIEASAVRAVAVVAQAVGAPVYIVHASCEEGVREASEAKLRGTEVYVESCPHYLFLDLDDVPPGGQGFVLPPLRERGDRDALRRAAASGLVDTLGSDHCGHGPAAKPTHQIAGAKAGLPGLESMLPLIVDAVIGDDPWLSRQRAVQLLSSNAASVFGLAGKGSIDVGFDADLVAIDPAGQRRLSVADFHDAANYSPYEGMTTRGSIARVWRRGQLVVRDGEAHSTGGGRFVRGSGAQRRGGA